MIEQYVKALKLWLDNGIDIRYAKAYFRSMYDEIENKDKLKKLLDKEFKF